MGTGHRMNAPYQAFRRADGYITVGANARRLWEAFAKAIGRPELITRRMTNRGELTEIVESVLITRSRADWLSLLENAGVPAGPVNSYVEVFADPKIQARGHVKEVQYPDGVKARVMGPPVRIEPQSPKNGWVRAPEIGEHTEAVLQEAGLTSAEVARLKQIGAVR